MPIKKLPPHIVNRLKAGEIVERPVAVVKELIENALDAGATRLDVVIEKGGKQLIRVQDNGSGIDTDDLLMTVERYATSKIVSDRDLDSIASYGFRGEALASIGEVATLTIQTRGRGSNLPDGVGEELRRDAGVYQIKQIAVPYSHGTVVSIADLFQSVPARLKFLKSDATEWNYIKQLFVSYSLVHRDKAMSLTHNGKKVFSFAKHDSVIERMQELYNDERAGKWHLAQRSDEQIDIVGVVGDASLHFPSQQYMHIFVNNRPVQDRLIKRAIMEAYERQIVPGSFPFVHIFIDIDPKLVDVNVHPRKLEVKFLDPGSIFTRVKETILTQLGTEKVNYAAFTKNPVKPDRKRSGSLSSGQMDAMKSWQGSSTHAHPSQTDGPQQDVLVGQGSVSRMGGFGTGNAHEVGTDADHFSFAGDDIVLIGQLRNSYIIAQGRDDVYYIDQHALAERIAFEKMRTTVSESGFEREVLLQPLTVQTPKDIDVEPILDVLSKIGFDGALFGVDKVVFYAIPAVFAAWKIDIELVMQRVWGYDQLLADTYRDNPQKLFGLIIDEMLGMKACKASIKAGQKLQYIEMKQLLEDGMRYVDGLFVCQHGRPSVVKVERKYVDALFDR